MHVNPSSVYKLVSSHSFYLWRGFKKKKKRREKHTHNLHDRRFMGCTIIGKVFLSRINNISRKKLNTMSVFSSLFGFPHLENMWHLTCNSIRAPWRYFISHIENYRKRNIWPEFRSNRYQGQQQTCNDCCIMLVKEFATFLLRSWQIFFFFLKRASTVTQNMKYRNYAKNERGRNTFQCSCMGVILKP